jgi:hypothetical protein
MSTRYLIRLAIMTAGLFGAAALSSGLPKPAVAQEIQYPWCTIGEEVHCYYATRQQCEEAVDYHGFCDLNPSYRAPAGNTPRQNRSR